MAPLQVVCDDHTSTYKLHPFPKQPRSQNFLGTKWWITKARVLDLEEEDRQACTDGNGAVLVPRNVFIELEADLQLPALTLGGDLVRKL